MFSCSKIYSYYYQDKLNAKICIKNNYILDWKSFRLYALCKVNFSKIFKLFFRHDLDVKIRFEIY